MPNDLASILRVGQQTLVSFGVKSVEQVRYLTIVRGWVAGNYIMLDSPAFQNRPISLVLGAPCSVRFLAEGTACGFSSAIVRASRNEPIIQIAWPSSVEYLIVRKYERIRLFIPCTLHSKQFGVVTAELRDLSVGGCRIFTPVSLKPGADFTISFESFAGAMLGPLAAVSRNENPSGAGFLVGCQFDALGDVARLELECFVSLKRESMRDGSELTRRVIVIGTRSSARRILAQTAGRRRRGVGGSAGSPWTDSIVYDPFRRRWSWRNGICPTWTAPESAASCAPRTGWKTCRLSCLGGAPED